MSEITRLPKGHKVICAFPISEGRINRLKSKDVTFTQDDDKIFLECFVSGDTPEKGLSVVALDNPEYCLHSSSGNLMVGKHTVRELCAQGYYNYWIVEGEGRGMGVSCPY